MFQFQASKVRTPFRQPSEAQFWYEWQTKGLFYPVVVSIVIGFLLLLWPFHSAGWYRTNSILPELHEGLLGLGLFLSVLAVANGGLLGFSTIGADKRQRDPTVSDMLHNSRLHDIGPFQAALPITEAGLANAILRTAAQSLLAAWSLWAGPFVMYLALAYMTNQMPDSIFPTECGVWYLPLTFLGPWILMTNLAVVGLTGRFVFLISIAMCVLISCTIALIVISELVSPSVYEQLIRLGSVLVNAVVVTGTFCSFLIAHQRALIGRKTLALTSVLSLAIVILALVFRPLNLMPLAYPVILAFAALVVAPLATTPLAIAWNRHR